MQFLASAADISDKSWLVNCEVGSDFSVDGVNELLGSFDVIPT